jgi:hypothetical protein
MVLKANVVKNTKNLNLNDVSVVLVLIKNKIKNASF